MNLGLQNQVAWICGSTGAIGAAVARTLTDEGVSLALSARDANALDALVAELRPAAPHPPLALPLDMSVRASVDTAAKRILSEHGRLDILVNTTALPLFGDFLALEDAAWEEIFQAKYFGYMRTMRAVIPQMVSQARGCIVNISGRGGHQPSSASHLPGSSANAAVNLLTKGLANIYGDKGLRINAVAPGPIASQRFDRLAAANDTIAHDAPRASAKPATTVAGLGQPHDIASIVAFLVSDHAAHLNGLVVQADGGSTLTL